MITGANFHANSTLRDLELYLTDLKRFLVFETCCTMGRKEANLVENFQNYNRSSANLEGNFFGAKNKKNILSNDIGKILKNTRRICRSAESTKCFSAKKILLDAKTNIVFSECRNITHELTSIMPHIIKGLSELSSVLQDNEKYNFTDYKQINHQRSFLMSTSFLEHLNVKSQNLTLTPPGHSYRMYCIILQIPS
ncbi:hypothetical protein X975_20181, partial [Stegodyphus mimosarum]